MLSAELALKVVKFKISMDKVITKMIIQNNFYYLSTNTILVVTQEYSVGQLQ